MEAAPEAPARIVFFDGVCGLCNRFVDLLLRVDRTRILRYAPLQGTTAAALLPQAFGKNMDTVVYLRDGRLFTRSDAAIRILRDTGGIRRCAAALLLLPRPIRDSVYAWVARNRYGWFGQLDACRLPSPEERSYFLP